jgi:hypothetical protein
LGWGVGGGGGGCGQKGQKNGTMAGIKSLTSGSPGRCSVHFTIA